MKHVRRERGWCSLCHWHVHWQATCKAAAGGGAGGAWAARGTIRPETCTGGSSILLIAISREGDGDLRLGPAGQAEAQLARFFYAAQGETCLEAHASALPLPALRT